MKKFISSIMIIFCIFAFQSGQTAKANTYGGKWKKNIKIYIPPNSTVTGPMGTAVNSWNSKLSNVYSNITIWKVYTPSEANVIVTPMNSMGEVLGQAYIYPSEFSSSYTGGKILINLNKFNQLSASEKTTIATHELGHILGLAHTTSGNYSIMVANIADISPIIYPTSYDKAQLGLLY